MHPVEFQPYISDKEESDDEYDDEDDVDDEDEEDDEDENDEGEDRYFPGVKETLAAVDRVSAISLHNICPI